MTDVVLHSKVLFLLTLQNEFTIRVVYFSMTELCYSKICSWHRLRTMPKNHESQFWGQWLWHSSFRSHTALGIEASHLQFGSFIFRQLHWKDEKVKSLTSCFLWGRLNSWVVSHLALIIGTLCHGPWVRASVTTNSFLDPSTTSMLSSRFLFDLFDLILLFVYQIFHVNCEIENWK